MVRAFVVNGEAKLEWDDDDLAQISAVHDYSEYCYHEHKGTGSIEERAAAAAEKYASAFVEDPEGTGWGEQPHYGEMKIMVTAFWDGYVEAMKARLKKPVKDK